MAEGGGVSIREREVKFQGMEKLGGKHCCLERGGREKGEGIEVRDEYG